MESIDFIKSHSEILNNKIDFTAFITKAKYEIDKRGYYLAKDFIEEEIYKICREESINFFRKKNLIKNKLEDCLRGDISAGMRDVSGFTKNKTWHLFRNCSFNWNKSNNEIANIIMTSRCLSKVRNILNDKYINYGDSIEEDGYIAYTSLSLYPTGGGFLKEHHDGLEYNSETTKQGKILHFKIELTHLGQDYKEGGFFIKDKETKQYVNLSEKSNPRDVIFFDGSQNHLIKNIDGGLIGRIAFFQIPTFVSNGSRIGLYSGDGWSKSKTVLLIVANKLLYLIKKIIKKFISFLI